MQIEILDLSTRGNEEKVNAFPALLKGLDVDVGRLVSERSMAVDVEKL